MRYLTRAVPTPEYATWVAMRERTSNPRNKFYKKYYIDRGITICERWQAFENFLADMGRKPSPEHSIDRVDNDKGYAPENCRWATALEQVMNRSNTKWLEYNGERKTAAQWAESLGMTKEGLYARLRKNGHNLEMALTIPRRSYPR